MKNKDFTVQETLSLGYIYLVILGIITEVIYYNFAHINIFEYSSILDVLISPISFMTTNLAVMCVFLGVIGLLYYMTAHLTPRLHFKLRDRAWYRKTTDVEKYDRLYENFDLRKKLIQLAFVIFFMFLGFGSARGLKLKRQLESGDVKVTHSIVFSDGVTKEVRIVGQNSAYMFYIAENQQTVSVSPINMNIREIRRIDK